MLSKLFGVKVRYRIGHSVGIVISPKKSVEKRNGSSLAGPKSKGSIKGRKCLGRHVNVTSEKGFQKNFDIGALKAGVRGSSRHGFINQFI